METELRENHIFQEENCKPSYLAQREMEVKDQMVECVPSENLETRTHDLQESTEDLRGDGSDVPEILENFNLSEWTSDEIFAIAGLKELKNQKTSQESDSPPDSLPFNESYYKDLLIKHDFFEMALLEKIRTLESKLRKSEDVVKRIKICNVKSLQCRRQYLQMENLKLRRQRKSDVVEIQNLTDFAESLQKTLDICHSQLEFSETEFEFELDSLTLMKNQEIRKLMIENLKLQDSLSFREREIDSLRNRIFNVQFENWHLKTQNQKLDNEKMMKFRDYEEFQGYRDEKIENLEKWNSLNLGRIHHLEYLLKLQNDDLHAKNLKLKDLKLENWKLENHQNLQTTSYHLETEDVEEVHNQIRDLVEASEQKEQYEFWSCEEMR